ncbi:hypothetical protein Veis_4501 [Verminephrobacter eiseniae EF01-2]|uniref:Uncharacterized protein n=1 Tax=Verminephrobacter eiseniae (strain EF01-2) TaxID=391735 RepID=A1WRE4_VEREI|nr:hypothetical protein Veis_4501 [Verminephrobacter eiseniae EF01-2]
MLDPIKKTLDHIALLVQMSIMTSLHHTIAPGWNDRRRTVPNSAGKSRHGEPVRMIHNTVSKNSRLAWAVAPGSLGLPGNDGDNFSHCSSHGSFLTSCILGSYSFKEPNMDIVH